MEHNSFRVLLMIGAVILFGIVFTLFLNTYPNFSQAVYDKFAAGVPKF